MEAISIIIKLNVIHNMSMKCVGLMNMGVR